MSELNLCPSCSSPGMSVFYELEGVPVNSVVLLNTREEALAYPTGDISLALCHNCGFISNVAFDEDLLEYSSRYEATQSYSPTFSAFAHRLATRLVEQYGLYNKDIIEIGSGQGEFLTMLCEIGINRGVGFDPAYVSTRTESEAADRLTFVADFYSEKYADYRGDFVCCKMTLEHIHSPADFVRTVRTSLGDTADTVVFFQVPDTTRVLRELAFWDVYYEHCSYFSAGSLARLFRRSGFDVMRLAAEYGGQYLMIEARPGTGMGSAQLAAEDDLEDLLRDVEHFAAGCPGTLETWERDIKGSVQAGRRVVLWGGGSKAVAFLTTLKLEDQIEYVVDINPHKHGTYLPGAGQEVVAPSSLKAYRPDLVVIMNPIYQEEIGQDLKELGLTPELVSLGADS